MHLIGMKIIQQIHQAEKHQKLSQTDDFLCLNVLNQYCLLKFNYWCSKKMQMFTQFSMIRDFDALSDYQCDYTTQNASHFHKDDMNKETLDNDLQPSSGSIFTRSIKTKTDRQEVSFGQNLMKEHLKSFKNMLQKYMEQCFQQSVEHYKLKSLTDSYHQIKIEDLQDADEVNLSELLQMQKRRLTQMEKKQFLLDLSFEEKLNQFLCYICKQTCFQISADLLYIAKIIWQTYIPNQQYGLNQKQIDDIIQTILTKKFDAQNLKTFNLFSLRTNFLTSKISQEQMILKLKDLIRCFGVTIFLILQEYFHNPYFKNEQKDCLKRNYIFKDISNDEFSDDEEEGVQFSLGTKKRKL